MNGCFTFIDQKVCVIINEIEYVNPENAPVTIAGNLLDTG